MYANRICDKKNDVVYITGGFRLTMPSVLHQVLSREFITSTMSQTSIILWQVCVYAVYIPTAHLSSTATQLQTKRRPQVKINSSNQKALHKSWRLSFCFLLKLWLIFN